MKARVHKLRAAKNFLGIPKLSMQEPWARKLALGLTKAWIVSARERGLDEFAAELSAMKGLFEPRQRDGCAICGVAVNKGRRHCQMHMIQNRSMRMIEV